MTKEQMLTNYMEAMANRNTHLRPSVIRMPSEPKVELREKVFPIPENVWDSEQYGDIDDLIEYLRRVNGVPGAAFMEILVDDHSSIVKIRFTWWDVTILTHKDDRNYTGAA